MTSLTMDNAISSAAQSNIDSQAAALNALSSNSASDAEKRKKLGQAAEGFEALFLQQMWEEMRSSLPKDGLFTSSKEEQFWQSMYDEELGKHMASAGGIGLANMMIEQLDGGIQDVARAKNMPNKSGGLQIAPAPMFDLDMIREKKASEQAVIAPKNEIISAQTAPISNANLYEEVSQENRVQNIDNTPRQTASEAVAQRVANTVAQVNAQNPNSKSVNEEVVLAEPVVTKVTYQTNSTTTDAQRKKNNDVVQTILADARDAYKEYLETEVKAQSALYEEMPILENEQVYQMPNFAPISVPIQQNIMQTVPSHEPQDILSGITTTYQKGRHLKPVEEVVPMPIGNGQFTAQKVTTYVEDHRTVPSLAARAALQPNSAGGPDLMQPQPITKTFDLGFLNPERGSMADPVEGGTVTSGFGWRLDPINGKRSWHNGVDIKAEEGTPVLAAESGKVIFSGVDPEFGNMVILEHPNGLQSLYGHNGSLNVNVGDTIQKGTEIATVGSTGRAIGAHLHFEIRKADLPVNPEHVLSQYYDYS